MLLHVAFAGLCLASTFGLILFVGYTFRIKVRYPLQFVSAHWMVAAATFIVLCIWVYQTETGPSSVRAGLVGVWIWVTLILYAVTLGSGILFYFTHDIRRKPLRVALVGSHIIIACMTFIAFTSLLPLETPVGVKAHLYSTGRWPLVHRNRTIHQRFHPTQETAQNMTTPR